MIGTVDAGLRGFAALRRRDSSPAAASRSTTSGSSIPQIAPSDHFLQVWEHYGMTADAIVERIRRT